MDCSVNDRLFTNSLRLTSGVASLQRMESEEELSTRTSRSSATCAPRMESSGFGVAKQIRHGMMFGATFCSKKMQYREKMSL